MSLLNGAILWWVIARLQPGKMGGMLALAWGGTMLRWFLVALLLVLALRHSLISGLLAFAGIFLTHLVLAGLVGLRRASLDHTTSE